jgi:hypothetical protein
MRAPFRRPRMLSCAYIVIRRASFWCSAGVVTGVSKPFTGVSKPFVLSSGDGSSDDTFGFLSSSPRSCGSGFISNLFRFLSIAHLVLSGQQGRYRVRLGANGIARWPQRPSRLPRKRLRRCTCGTTNNVCSSPTPRSRKHTDGKHVPIDIVTLLRGSSTGCPETRRPRRRHKWRGTVWRKCRRPYISSFLLFRAVLAVDTRLRPSSLIEAPDSFRLIQRRRDAEADTNSDSRAS